MSSTIKPQRCIKCEKEVITIIGKFDQWGVLVFRCADCWRIEEGDVISWEPMEVPSALFEWQDFMYRGKKEGDE